MARRQQIFECLGNDLANKERTITSKPTFETKPDLDKEVAKITEHKALPEPQEKSKVSISDDDIDEDTDDLDKIKSDIMRVLSKLDQAEVE